MEYVVGQQVAPGLVVIHEQTLDEFREHRASLTERLNAALLQLSEVRKDASDWKALADAAKPIIEEKDRLIDELREIVDLAVDIGGVRFHEEGCPEDDTCDCPDVKRVNDAMGRDWKSKREPNSINLPTSEKRKCVCQGGSRETGCLCGCHFGLGK